MKKSDLFMIGSLILAGLGTLAGHVSEKADMQEEVKKEVDRQLHPEKEKEEEP